MNFFVLFTQEGRKEQVFILNLQIYSYEMVQKFETEKIRKTRNNFGVIILGIFAVFSRIFFIEILSKVYGSFLEIMKKFCRKNSFQTLSYKISKKLV